MSGRPDHAELALYEAMEREFNGGARSSRGGEIAPAAHLEPEVDEWMTMEQGGGEAKGSLWEMVDDRMRGRWRYAIALGLALGLVLAVIGYGSAEPMYRGEGLVRINDTVNLGILPQNQGSSLGNQIDAFISMQSENIRGAKVIQAALNDERMSKYPWVNLPGAKGRLRDFLEAEPNWQSHHILVWYDSEDPLEAFEVVKVVLQAYDDFFGDTRQAKTMERRTKLKIEKSDLEKEITQAVADIGERQRRHSAADLQAVTGSNLAKIQEKEAFILECKHHLERVEDAMDPNSPEQQQLMNPTDRDLEAFDKQLAQYRAGLDSAEVNFRSVELSYQPGSPVYRNAEIKFNNARTLYEDRHKLTLNEWLAGVQSGSVQALPTSVLYGLSEDMVRRRMAEASSQLEALRAQSGQLLEDSQQIKKLERDNEVRQREVDRLNAEITEIDRSETALANLIEVELPPMAPLEPQKDQRLLRLGMGAVGGLGFSFGLFFLWGTIDRRAYGATQLGAGAKMPPCLGVLPDLGRSMKDPESSDVASHCVHQIRNQIEAVRGAGKSCVIAFTSPFQGDGKTSIVMALSWSYAAAGYKTIVVDCDMVGRSLTRQLGLIGRDGLKEVLKADQVNGEITPLAVPNLSALPVGTTTQVGPESVRRVDMLKLFEQLKKSYEVILVDTGPLLGALETTPVAATADGVVLAVRRGRSKVRLQECVKKLGSVGARCYGVILNCAVRSECHRYVSEASLAAAEDNRASRSGAAQTIVRRPTAGERNVLVRAMEDTLRAREES